MFRFSSRKNLSKDLTLWYRGDNGTQIYNNKGELIVWLNSARPSWKLFVIKIFWRIKVRFGGKQ